MHRNRPLLVGLLLAAAGIATAAVADSGNRAMQKLATDRGCMTCHAVEPGAMGTGGQPPIGPAWRDVAAKYQGQKDAAAKLTQTVIAGSNPYASHWAGKVSGLAMPPNAVVVKPADARRLVNWILGLDGAAKP